MAFRRQQTSLQTVAAYHRALDTMGRLAAEQAAAPPPTKPANPESAYVRVVPADTAPPVPPKPPSVRSRPRRTPPTPTPTPPPAPGPNTRIVTAEDEVANPGPGRRPEPPLWPLEAGSLDAGPWPLESGPIGRIGDDEADLTSPYPPAVGRADVLDHPVGAPAPVGDPGTIAMPEATGQAVLHFDAIDDYPASEGPASWGQVAPSQPDRDARSGPRSRRGRTGSARGRSRRPAPVFRSSGSGRRPWVAGAVAAVVLIVAAVVGYTLAAGSSHGRHPASSPPATTSPPPARPAASAATTPTTAPPPTAILVSSSVGSSTYRVDASATITFQANGGTCWVEIRQSGPYGPVLFTGDLFSGQSRDMNGPIWVRLGNPVALVITVNGTSISPPGMAAGEPYDLQFA